MSVKTIPMVGLLLLLSTSGCSPQSADTGRPHTFGTVFRQKRTDISLMVVFLLILVVISSSLMFFVEHAEQPDKFSSIPAAMWWSVMTLTTVGYGDIYPMTPLGKFIGSMIALIGIGFFALPAGVLAAAFADQLAQERAGATPQACPHCGKPLE